MKTIIKNQIHIVNEDLQKEDLKINIENIDEVFKDSFKYWCKKLIFKDYKRKPSTDDFVIRQFTTEVLQGYTHYDFEVGNNFLDVSFLKNRLFKSKMDEKLLLVFPFCVDEIEYKNSEYVLSNESERGFLYRDYDGNFKKTNKMIKTIQTIMVLLRIQTLEVFFIEYNFWDFKQQKILQWESNKNIYFENILFDESFKNILCDLEKWFNNFILKYISPPFNKENKFWFENTYKKRIT